MSANENRKHLFFFFVFFCGAEALEKCILVQNAGNLEVQCSLLSAVFAELVLQCAVKGSSKLDKVAPSLATHLMAKGMRAVTAS